MWQAAVTKLVFDKKPSNNNNTKKPQKKKPTKKHHQQKNTTKNQDAAYTDAVNQISSSNMHFCDFFFFKLGFWNVLGFTWTL